MGKRMALTSLSFDLGDDGRRANQRRLYQKNRYAYIPVWCARERCTCTVHKNPLFSRTGSPPRSEAKQSHVPRDRVVAVVELNFNITDTNTHTLVADEPARRAQLRPAS